MYNTPRQATVTCTSDAALLWALRRGTFQDIQHLCAMDFQHSMVSALEGVELLNSSLEKAQLQTLADAAEVVDIAQGTRVITQARCSPLSLPLPPLPHPPPPPPLPPHPTPLTTQGDLGDAFYIILAGSMQCISDKSGTVVMELQRGDYFGERALLNDDPRAVHVDATTDAVLAKITRAVFTEVLGPLQALMETELTRRILKSVPILAHLTEGDRDQARARPLPSTAPSPCPRPVRRGSQPPLPTPTPPPFSHPPPPSLLSID